MSTIDVANDPFFGRAGKMLANNQRDQNLKFELLIPITSVAKPTACMSFNYHQDAFGPKWGLNLEDGSVAHTACVGFGLERIALALFHHHGLDVEALAGKRAQGAVGLNGSMTSVFPRSDPDGYQPHALHSSERMWPETNCYVDLWIEVLNAVGAAAGGDAGLHADAGFRGRPVHLLQGAAGGSRGALRHPRHASLRSSTASSGTSTSRSAAAVSA